MQKRNQTRGEAMGEGAHSPIAMAEQAGSEHSPLPWEAMGEWQSSDGSGWSIECGEDEIAWLAHTKARPDAQADAEFIVRAVSHHHELVEVVHNLVFGSACACNVGDHDADEGAAIGCIWCAARAVLAEVRAR